MEKAPRQSSTIALLVAGALFMEQLDGTVIATALPQMAQSFGVAPVDLNIGMSAYLLTVAVFIPASGWVADRFGARMVFASAIATFTLRLGAVRRERHRCGSSPSPASSRASAAP